ncbi:MAG: DNA polymerase III subunit beta [Zetaproteobacteria bacterium CG2_30_46_52]|nr:MAG: DNA polymerase III subunit beta [Zetaproteobacteria bacterium CG2_30_46_52]
MHLKISRAHLFHQIQRCQNIVEKRNTNPILVNILFETVSNGLKLTATDLQATYSSTQEAEILEPGKLTVDAKKIFEIVRELNPEQMIELKTKPNFLEIFSGGVKFEIAAKSADEFPSEPTDETDLSISLPGSELIRMIGSTSFAMSNDETRKYLTGSLFEVSPEHGIRIVTTDGHRMALSEFNIANLQQSASCILPKKAVMELKRLAEEAEENIQLSLGQHQVRIELNQQRFTSKVIDAKYPVYQDVIPQSNPHTALVDKNLLDQALRRSMVVSNDFTHDVKLIFTDNNLSIAAHNTEQEQAEEDMVIAYEGTTIEVGFNAKYMRDVLAAVSSQNVRIVLKDSLSPALLLEEGHELSKHVLMPMRI